MFRQWLQNVIYWWILEDNGDSELQESKPGYIKYEEESTSRFEITDDMF
jgi:hypothetical protein